MTEDKLTHMKKQYDQRKQSILSSLTSLQNEFSAIQSENQEGLERIEAAQDEVRALESKIQNERVEFEREIAGMMDVFEKFARSIEFEERRLLQKLE